MGVSITNETVDAEFFRSRGFDVRNALITHADLSMTDHGCLTLELVLEGDGWGVTYGGRVLGHGYLNAEEFEGNAKGIEYLMRIMDTVGVERFNDMKGKYVRVVTKGWGNTVDIIGNIARNKWFDQRKFFEGEQEGQ